MTKGKRAVGQQFKANCWGRGGWAGGRQWGECKEKVERSSHCAFCQEMGEAGLGRTQMALGLSQGCPPWWMSQLLDPTARELEAREVTQSNGPGG